MSIEISSDGMDDNLDSANSIATMSTHNSSSEESDNVIHLFGEDWKPRVDLWALLPLLFSIAAVMVHSLAARVLWRMSVQWISSGVRRSTATDLQHLMLAVSGGACAVLLAATAHSGELLVGRWLAGQVLCQILTALNTAGHGWIMLINLYILLRVILNQQLMRKHHIFLLIVAVLMFCFLCLTAAFTSSSSEYALGCYTNFPIWMSIAINLTHLISLVVSAVLIVVCCLVLRKRRCGIHPAEFQPEPDNTSVNNSSELTTDPTSSEFIQAIENLAVVVVLASWFGYLARFVTVIVFMTQTSAYSLATHQLVYLMDLLWESIMLFLSGSLYLLFYPDYRFRIKELLPK